MIHCTRLRYTCGVPPPPHPAPPHPPPPSSPSLRATGDGILGANRYLAGSTTLPLDIDWADHTPAFCHILPCHRALAGYKRLEGDSTPLVVEV